MQNRTKSQICSGVGQMSKNCPLYILFLFIIPYILLSILFIGISSNEAGLKYESDVQTLIDISDKNLLVKRMEEKLYKYLLDPRFAKLIKREDNQEEGLSEELKQQKKIHDNMRDGCVAWQCLTCEQDPAIYICSSCFLNSDHKEKGHEVRIKRFKKAPVNLSCICGETTNKEL